MIDSLELPALLLFLLPAVLFVVVLAITGKARIRAGMGAFVLVSRSALVVALIILLAGPQVLQVEESKVQLDVLIDVSRSLGVGNRDQLIAEAEAFVLAQVETNESLTLKCVAFAGNSSVFLRGRTNSQNIKDAFVKLRRPDSLAALSPLESNLAAAIRISNAGSEADLTRNRVVFTDGALPSPPRDLWDDCATWIVAPQLTAGPSFVANSIGMPQRIEEGQPLPMELTYTSSLAKELETEIFIDGVSAKKTKLQFEVGKHQLGFSGEDIILGPGVHEIMVKVHAEDDEELDDIVGAQVKVSIKKHVLYVRGDHDGSRAPAIQRALRAQKIDILASEAATLPVDESYWRRVKAVVLDRVAPADVSPEVAARIRQNAVSGGGLFLIPRDATNELMAWNRHELADFLPLTGLPEIKPEPEDKPKTDDEAEKISKPDIKKSKEKVIDAPTLSLLLVIDNSASMKEGGRMLFAIRGAIATLRKLHPEDRIGVIAYNDSATEVVPVQEVGNRESIERAIMRIRPEGATDIKSALEFAKSTLQREDAAVKSIVLLSDGFTRPFNVKKTAQDLQSNGISVITVGVGSSFDTGTLTQIAKYSGGTGPIPARNAKQLPAIMVDVAARLIDQNNLRSAPEEKKEPEDDIHRPETALGQNNDKTKTTVKEEKVDGRIDIKVLRPTSYLDRLPLNFAPSIYGLHRSLPKPAAWVSLATKNAVPVLAHWRAGEGVVAMSALALEGDRAKDLVLWEAYSPLVAQIVRFCSWDAAFERFQLHGQVQGSRAVLALDDSQSRDNTGAWQIVGDDKEAKIESLGDGRYVYETKQESQASFLRLAITPPGELIPQPLSLFIPPPLEISSRGLDLGRLEEWAEALGGEFEPGRAIDLNLKLKPKKSWNPKPYVWQGIGFLLLLFAIELLMKRYLRKPQTES